MTICARRMRSDEGQAVADLMRTVIAALSYYNTTAREAEIRKYDPESLADMVRADPDSVLVATAADAPAGFCVSKLDDGLIWLAWLGVHPGARRRGVAALLLRELEATAPARGCHKVWADSRTDNEAMKVLFPKMGYARICCVKDHWYRQDFYLWEKLIAPGPASVGGEVRR